MSIERLAAHHERRGFDCGEPALNEFLLRQAGQIQRKGSGKTYVTLDSEGIRVIGFVTISAAQVSSVTLPDNLKLPRYPVPAVRIGRLAVDSRFQGRGIGQDLLAFGLRIALEFSEKVGVYAVLVDAKDEAASAFYARLGFLPTKDNPLSLFLPVATLMQTRTET